MSAPWPPPPDLESVQQLVREADIEGLLAQGAPADEYEPEEQAILSAIAHLPTAQLTAMNLQPILKGIWCAAFNVSGEDLAKRDIQLAALAEQIERFFGPEAKPQVR